MLNFYTLCNKIIVSQEVRSRTSHKPLHMIKPTYTTKLQAPLISLHEADEAV
jgi:hypothetical protein